MVFLNIAVAFFTISIFLAIIGFIQIATYGVWIAAGLSTVFVIRYLWKRIIG